MENNWIYKLDSRIVIDKNFVIKEYGYKKDDLFLKLGDVKFPAAKFSNQFINKDSEDLLMLPGVRFLKKISGNQWKFLFEEPPQIKTVYVSPALIDYEKGMIQNPEIVELFLKNIYKIKGRYAVRLSFPFVIFTGVIRKIKENVFDSMSLSAYIAPRQLNSFDDKLYLPPLSNIMFTGSVCCPRTSGDTIGSTILNQLRVFWESEFNTDYYNGRKYTSESGNELGTILAWNYNTKIDPLFIYDKKFVQADSLLSNLFNGENLITVKTLFERIQSSFSNIESDNFSRIERTLTYLEIQKDNNIIRLDIGDEIVIGDKVLYILNIFLENNISVIDYDTNETKEIKLTKKISHDTYDYYIKKKFLINNLEFSRGDLIHITSPMNYFGSINRIVQRADGSQYLKLDNSYFNFNIKNLVFEKYQDSSKDYCGESIKLNKKYFYFRSGHTPYEIELSDIFIKDGNIMYKTLRDGYNNNNTIIPDTKNLVPIEKVKTHKEEFFYNGAQIFHISEYYSIDDYKFVDNGFDLFLDFSNVLKNNSINISGRKNFSFKEGDLVIETRNTKYKVYEIKKITSSRNNNLEVTYQDGKISPLLIYNTNVNPFINKFYMKYNELYSGIEFKAINSDIPGFVKNKIYKLIGFVDGFKNIPLCYMSNGMTVWPHNLIQSFNVVSINELKIEDLNSHAIGEKFPKVEGPKARVPHLDGEVSFKYINGRFTEKIINGQIKLYMGEKNFIPKIDEDDLDNQICRGIIFPRLTGEKNVFLNQNYIEHNLLGLIPNYFIPEEVLKGAA